MNENEWEQFGMTEQEWKSLHKSKRWRLRNPEKQKQATRNWVEKNQEHRKAITRKWQLKTNYGITEEQYASLLNEQQGCCAICKTDKPTGKWKVFAVDHCHITGRVRGLLCNECNRGMGLLKDNADLLREAAEYLERNNERTK